MAIDERLVAAAGAPGAHRDAAIDALEANVVQLEATIAEMVTSITVADSKQQLEQAVSAADLKLQALAEARAEVEMIDRQVAGTDDVATEVVQRPRPLRLRGLRRRTVISTAASPPPSHRRRTAPRHLHPRPGHRIGRHAARSLTG